MGAKEDIDASALVPVLTTMLEHVSPGIGIFDRNQQRHNP